MPKELRPTELQAELIQVPCYYCFMLFLQYLVKNTVLTKEPYLLKVGLLTKKPYTSTVLLLLYAIFELLSQNTFLTKEPYLLTE